MMELGTPIEAVVRRYTDSSNITPNSLFGLFLNWFDRNHWIFTIWFASPHLPSCMSLFFVPVSTGQAPPPQKYSRSVMRTKILLLSVGYFIWFVPFDFLVYRTFPIKQGELSYLVTKLDLHWGGIHQFGGASFGMR